MLSVDAITPNTAPETTVSERRLAANRANAQLSTGPRTAEGKAISSLNAVKTGLTGQAVLLADEEEARQYQAHLDRVFTWWAPVGDREHTLVQALADTQWRLNSIPGLESALRALARARGETLLSHPDPTIQRVLLQAQAEVAEAKALKNLRLQESRLRRHYEKDEAELKNLRSSRFSREREIQAQEREQQRREEEEQRRRERAQKRIERKQTREAAPAPHPSSGETVLLDANGFEFSNAAGTDLAHLTMHKGNGD